MAKILVHVTQGPENPTAATLGFLVAKTAMDEGHQVTMFLAGDAVTLLKDAVLENLTGLGTGKLKEHFDALKAANVSFYLSGMSAKSRGFTEAELQNKSAQFAMPNILVKLSLEHDRMFCY